MNLSLLSKLGSIKTYGIHDFICVESEMGEEMYILLKGKVGVFINSFVDHPIQVAELTPGHFFGEMSLLENLPRTATIVALEDHTTTLTIDKNNFNKVLISEVDVAYQIMDSLAQRIKNILAQFQDRVDVSSALQQLQFLGLETGCTFQQFKVYMATHSHRIEHIIKGLSHLLRNLNEQIAFCNAYDHSTPQEENTDLSSGPYTSLFPKGHKHYDYPITGDYSDYLLSRQVTCPICEHSFYAPHPRLTKARVVFTDGDLRKRYQDFEPLWYNILTCPQCYYSNYHTNFGNIHPKLKPKISELLISHIPNHKIDFKATLDINDLFTKYYLAILCSVEKRMLDLKLGKLWMNVAWLYKDVRDEAMFEYAYKKAFENYYQGYIRSSVELRAEDEQRLGIILGEYYYLHNQPEEARKFFFDVGRAKDGNKQLAIMAQNRIFDIKSR